MQRHVQKAVDKIIKYNQSSSFKWWMVPVSIFVPGGIAISLAAAAYNHSKNSKGGAAHKYAGLLVTVHSGDKAYASKPDMLADQAIKGALLINSDGDITSNGNVVDLWFQDYVVLELKDTKSVLVTHSAASDFFDHAYFEEK